MVLRGILSIATNSSPGLKSTRDAAEPEGKTCTDAMKCVVTSLYCGDSL